MRQRKERDEADLELLLAEDEPEGVNSRFVLLLSRARRRLGMTQGEVAALIDRSPSFISRMEAGDVQISLQEFVELVRALRFDPIEFLGKVLED